MELVGIETVTVTKGIRADDLSVDQKRDSSLRDPARCKSREGKSPVAAFGMTASFFATKTDAMYTSTINLNLKNSPRPTLITRVGTEAKDIHHEKRDGESYLVPQTPPGMTWWLEYHRSGQEEW